MISQLSDSFLQTTAAAGSWAVDLFWYTGSLCLLLVQSVGGVFSQQLRGKAVAYELWKIGIKSWFIVAMSSLFIEIGRASCRERV